MDEAEVDLLSKWLRARSKGATGYDWDSHDWPEEYFRELARSALTWMSLRRKPWKPRLSRRALGVFLLMLCIWATAANLYFAIKGDYWFSIVNWVVAFGAAYQGARLAALLISEWETLG